MRSTSPVLGIDLGTTNSVMALADADEPLIIENAEGTRTTPSVVAVNPKTGERLVGHLAKRQAIVNPENTIFSVKRLIGRKYDDPAVRELEKQVPYSIVPAPNGDAYVMLDGFPRSPQEISAMILQKLRLDAEEKLGREIREAVITVPAYFDDAQRKATKDAGIIAGLDVLRIINEPTAASLAYSVDAGDDGAERTVAVYDLGGGTFDISILRVAEGVCEVLASAGDSALGGDNIDERIVAWLCDEFAAEHGIDLRDDPSVMQRLREAAEKAKIELSSVVQTEINIPFICANAEGPKHLSFVLTRAMLERMVADLIERTAAPCRRALSDAQLRPAEIDEIILVGGQTRMPAIVDKVRHFFGKEPRCHRNPDEVVALGAAIQASIVKGQTKNVLLLDVTPLTLGIETVGGVVTPLIPRNTRLPAVRTEIFTTASDGQTAVDIHVLQGEHLSASENRSLGRFILAGIPPAPKGQARIEVTFDIDVNGVLNVTARDLQTGERQAVTLTANSGLSSEELARLMDEAQELAGNGRNPSSDRHGANKIDS